MVTFLAPLLAATVAASTPCTEEIFQGRHIRICPDAPVVQRARLYIDGVPLAVWARDGKFTTKLNQYAAYPSLQEAAHEAVLLLRGATLNPTDSTILQKPY